MSAKYILGALSLLLTNTHAAPTGNQPAPSTISYCPPVAATFATQQKIFAEFVEIMFTERNITKAYDIHLLADPEYVDHDAFHGASKAEVLALVVPWFHDTAFNVWNTFLQNDIGISVEMGVLANGTTAAFVDFWRFQGTCIVEHWDVIEFVTGDSPNPNPLFPLPAPLKSTTESGKSQ
ncbi:hypothetical protein H0G86_011991 [Trichoderma simmonsii]|uniref:SnoaL-like domain-containing protein n=1 Tax=Trichoderma simmonsii TaxID=1491479 RepID=A0A8G0LRN0_9HYPO|nr:hypothetical protein H0G86_011991 [Trichoderma simmonsii]